MTLNKALRRALMASVLLATFGVASAQEMSLKLTGSEEVPPVTTSATGAGKITVAADKSVSGSIKTTGIVGTAAHIHEAPAGKSGPPIITLTQSGDDTWTVPAGAKLTDAQYQAFKAGNLYVNIHSAEHKPGELRAQLKR
jgi:hypothetical protein